MSELQGQGLAINVNDLTFAYKKDQTHSPVLQHINLQLIPGARCVLIGPNGSGESE